jgi:GNAT superfamily N-acetyltransferase
MNFKFKYRKYAEALYEALRDDAFYTTMEASVHGRGPAREAMLKYMEFSMGEGGKYGELYIPGDHDYGVSIWAKPLSRELQAQKNHEKKIFLQNEMGEKSLNTYKAIVEFMSAQAEALVDQKAWYLSIIGILPEFQGQGLGPGLIQNVLKKTDALGVRTYLETFTPRNILFYKRIGYQETRSFYEPTTQCDYCLMVREPNFINSNRVH